MEAIDGRSLRELLDQQGVLAQRSSDGKAIKIDLGILFGIVDPYLHWYGTRQ